MTVADDPLAAALRAHLSETGRSMRALSLAAGLEENTVGYLLSGRHGRPRPESLAALSRVVGQDLAALPRPRVVTVADARRRLRETPPAGWSASQRRVCHSALSWYAKRAGADEAAAPFDRAALRAVIAAASPAALDVAASTHATYASLLRGLLDAMGPGRGRALRIDDVAGPLRAVHDRIAAGYETRHRRAAGPFLAWCAAEGLDIAAVGRAETFIAYRDHRVASGRLTQTEAAQTDHAKRALAAWNAAAADPALAHLGLAPVATPFEDRRRRHVAPAEATEALLTEYDRRVAPWLRGETTPDGRPADAVLDALDAPPAPADALLAAAQDFLGEASPDRRAARTAGLAAAGVLVEGQTWRPRRIANARAGFASLARAFYRRTHAPIETFAQLTHPMILKSAAVALAESDPDSEGSSYVAGLVKCAKKLARGYARRPRNEIEAIEALRRDFEPAHDGLNPRNKRKLQRFSRARLDRFYALSGELIAEVNAALARRRASIRRAEAAGRTPPPLVDGALARTVELAVLHDILTTRPPRAAEALSIDLASDVQRDAEGCVTIVIPAHRTKTGRDFKIPLNAEKTKLFDQFVKRFRPALLTMKNKRSTLLFPGRNCADRPAKHLFVRLVDEIERRVGVRIHPHLYRHLVGWVWLKKEPEMLPAVQKLLGHKKLETTMKFYAELDEDLALQQWQDFLEREKAEAAARAEPNLARGRRRGGRR